MKQIGLEYDNEPSLGRRSDSYYVHMWNIVTPLPESIRAIQERVLFVMSGRIKYDEIECKTKLPWYITGLIHCMEAFDVPDDPWLRSIRNGMPWNERNVHALPPVGPFKSFEDDANQIISYIIEYGMPGMVPGVTTAINHVTVSRMIEVWNGIFKYKKLKLHSPYLYGHSYQAGNHGKFKRLTVHSDGIKQVSEFVSNNEKITFKFDPEAFNKQPGAVLILKELVQLGVVKL